MTGRSTMPPDRDAPWDAVFVDRDGTLNVSPEPGAYVLHADDLVLLRGVGAAVALLNAAGAEVHVVTNQRAVALGLLDEPGLAAVNDRLVELLAAQGARVDSIQVCPHAVGVCDCRKPADGLLRRVFDSRPHLRPGRCAVVGDSWSDVRAGDALGLLRVLLAAPGAELGMAEPADLVCDDLPAAVHTLLDRSTPRGNVR